MQLCSMFYRIDLPREWDDDKLMNVLFLPFRDRRVNPASWDRKLKFWSELLINYCDKRGVVKVSEEHLKEVFKRKGKKPACLSTVLDNLYSWVFFFSRKFGQHCSSVACLLVSSLLQGRTTCAIRGLFVMDFGHLHCSCVACLLISSIQQSYVLLLSDSTSL